MSYRPAFRHFDPSIAWDRYLDGLHLQDVEEYDAEYRDSEENHVDLVECSLKELESNCYTFIYHYDCYSTGGDMIFVECVVTCELLRDGI